ncbi:hypothetical protein ACXYTJ_15275 [Gilvimarinus sp. F26214L]|uniref:hypothetical protein n=1 Tax=Gilvimarinus sp. DZF01 TaxID=3461371 RepID=UPI004046710E
MKQTVTSTTCRFTRAGAFCAGLLGAALFLAPLPGEARQIRSPQDLEYGTVLFEYYQQDYFEGLVEQAYATAINNRPAQSPQGQLLKGSMALSYGMPDVGKRIFDTLLANEQDEVLRNRAWYYLAKLYHSRSQSADAFAALENIRGRVPADLHLDYHYLATLVNNDGEHLADVQEAINSMPSTNRQYPYLLFNLGVTQLGNGNQTAALTNLARVVEHSDGSEELLVLADRARHGLAQLAMQDQRMLDAWTYLQDIRTEGLYSSRALLAYSWTAIRQELFEVSLPALQMLNQRSIALPEVQEGKVLLGHVYEQQGSMTRALRSHLQAEDEFTRGLEQVAEARRVIELQDVPREFITNLDAIVDQSDWFGVQPSLDYAKVTPFLVDLMASNAFHQVLRELAELYAIRDNLQYWARQTDQHDLILKASAEKAFDEEMKQVISDSLQLQDRLADQRAELGLVTLTLDTSDQRRLKSLLENSTRELKLLDDTLRALQERSEPYRQPPEYPAMVKQNHRRIAKRLEETEFYIAKLEPVMRNLVKAELDKHEERMRYYLAQARLAKARLYDTALIKLNSRDAGATQSGGNAQ